MTMGWPRCVRAALRREQPQKHANGDRAGSQEQRAEEQRAQDATTTFREPHQQAPFHRRHQLDARESRRDTVE